MKKPRKQPPRKNSIDLPKRKAVPQKKWSLNQRKAALRRRQTPFEKALDLLPKLSVAECKLLLQALKQPDVWMIKNIKRNYQEGFYKDKFNALVKIAEAPKHDSWGRWVNNRWRPYGERFIKKQHRQLTISDKPQEPH